MKWVRCPKCRTLNDVDRYLQCDGCSDSLEGVPPADSAPSGAAPAPENVTRPESWIFWALAAALLVATYFTEGISIFTAIAAFVLLAVLFMRFGFRHISRTGLNLGVKIILGLAASGAALFGAFLLVAFACSGPMSRVRW